jgi:protein SCO1/2
MSTRRTILPTLVALALLAPAARAQQPKNLTGPNGEGSHMEPAPDELKNITVDEHLGQTVPLDALFVDDTNQKVTLAKYFTGKKPVIVQLGYYGCPMLCDLVSKGLVKSMKDVELTAGVDYEVIFISIDPNENWMLAQSKKRAYAAEYGRGDAGFHFLTGRQADITRVAKAIGVNYKWVPSSAQFSHPAVIALASPDGKLTRYLYGVQFPKQTLRLSLVESSEGKIGTSTDRFLLTCFQYDGTHGKYAMTAMTMMRVGGAVSAITLAAILITLFRREAKRNAKERALNPTTTTTTAPAA